MLAQVRSSRTPQPPPGRMHRTAAAVAVTMVWLAVAAAAGVQDAARDDGYGANAGCTGCSRHKERPVAIGGGGSGENDRAVLEEANEAMRAHYRALLLHSLNITALAQGRPPPRSVTRTAAAARRLSLPDSSLLASFRDDVADDGIDGAAAEQYLLLAEDATAECNAVSVRRRLCLRFDLGSVATRDDETIARAVVVAARLYLWFPRGEFSASTGRGGGPLRVRQLSQISRFAAAASGPAMPEPPALDLSSRAVAADSVGVGNSSGWLYYELNRGTVRSSWLVGGGRRAAETILEVSCYDGGGGCAPQSWVATDFGEHRPFVLILVGRRDGGSVGGGVTRSPPRIWRRDDSEVGEHRRGATGSCGFGTRLYCDDVPLGQHTCCIERLKVSLSDFTNDQILEPKDFYPNYCRGSCEALGQQMSYSQTYFARIQLEAMKVHYTPCCAPTSTMSVDILYIDDNGAIRIKSMPHMVVDSCGCM